MGATTSAERAYARAYYLANQDRLRAKDRAYYAANREQKKAKHRARYAANPMLKRIEHLRHAFGITHADYLALLAGQGGCCAICRTDTPGAKDIFFHIDHDHVTGRIRGLLCMSCNAGLGSLGDDLERLEKAVEYLRQARAPKREVA